MSDTFLFQATAIFRRGQYVFNDPNNTFDFNAAKIDAFSPRNCWLLRQIIPGQNQVQYLPTFSPTSADLADTNTIIGLWAEQDGEGVMFDCISIENFNSAANNTGSITRRYSSPPAFTNPTAAWWCVTRSDDGSGFAHDQVVMAYVGQYVGNVRLKTNTSGVSVYTFQAYGQVTAIGTDTVAQC